MKHQRCLYRCITCAQDAINTRLHEFDRQCWKPIFPAIKSARIDGQVLAFEYSELPQFVKKRHEI